MNRPLHKLRLKPLSLFIGGALLSPLSAHADKSSELSDKAVEVIEVKQLRQSYRGNVKTKDLPQAIATISNETLEVTGITGLTDSLELVSGVTRQNDFGGLWDMFAIRGFAGDENLPSAYLINGFSAGRGFSGNRDTSNVEFIEVLKGPSSALYGRGEPGGTVNIITKKPRFEEAGYIKLTAGSFAQFRSEGDYTNAITPSLAFRVNGAYEDSKSYRDTVDKKKTVLTPSFLYQLSEDTLISYEVEYLKQQADMDRGVVFVQDKPFSYSRFYGEPADGPIEIDAMGQQVQIQHDLSSVWAFNAGLSIRTSSFEGSATEARWYDADNNYVVRQRRYREFDAEDYSGRFEFSGNAQLLGFGHNLLIGGDMYDYELERYILRYRHSGEEGDGADAYAIDYDNPIYREVLPKMALNTDDLEEQTGYGFYFQDQIDVTHRFKAMFGIRFDHFKQDITDRSAGATTSISNSYSNPRLGLVYVWSDEARIYSSYSEGARPNSGVNAEGVGHEPEESKSFEVGLKWELSELGFQGTTALFTTEKNNILASSPAGDGSTEAIGEAQSQGFEVDMSYNITPDTQISISYAYIDAENAKEITLWDYYVIEEGARLGNVPQHSGSVMFRQFADIGNVRGNGGVVVQYVGTQLGDFLEQDFELPSYTLVNLFLNVELTERLELNLNINNLLDEEYYQNSYFEAWTMPGAPKTVKASVKYAF